MVEEESQVLPELFQPVYSPWVNHIERLWHRGYMEPSRAIINAEGWQTCWPEVKHFMDTVSPFGEWLWHSEVEILGSVI